MPTDVRPVDAVHAAVRDALGSGEERYVLAVSGGCDSMVLLHAAAATMRARIAAVATFDHGTGSHARRAAQLVCDESARMGIPAVRGSGADSSIRRTEVAWREARWTFLHEVGERSGARCVTAHTRDDQVETVLMRILRGSGARGLAGLSAATAVRRPFLGVTRETLREYAMSTDVPFEDDPTNASKEYLRNRVRLDLLPAMRRVRPQLDDELLAVAERAVRVRSTLDACAARVSEVQSGGGVDVAASEVAGYSRESLAALWPAVAARAGLAMDRRGTERLAAFTINGGVGARVQLSGGWEVQRGRERFQLRRVRDLGHESEVQQLVGVVIIGGWKFSPGRERAGDPWTATLPAGVRLEVRRWRPGDRMVPAGSRDQRRVKRFLSDARILGPQRPAWPVVLAEGEVVWIPGVRRSDAATDRPGRPGVAYECELDER